MYYVYVLKSVEFEKFYTGQTDNLERRLLEHNSGKSIYSSRYCPWVIVYVENVNIKQEAVSRERYLKSSAGRRWLKKTVSR